MTDVEERYNQVFGQLTALDTAITEKQKRLNTLLSKKQTLENVVKILSRCIEESIDAKQYLEKVVNLWITTLYNTEENKYAFEFSLVKKKDGTISGYKPVVKRNGEVERQGKAMYNIISLVLRLCFLDLSGTANIIILDEPCANVRSDKFRRLVANLKEMQAKQNIQVIMVTHHFDVEFDHEIEIHAN